LKTVAQNIQTVPAFVPKAPDLLMAEVWRTKQRLNAEADYDIDKLLARLKREKRRTSTIPFGITASALNDKRANVI